MMRRAIFGGRLRSGRHRRGFTQIEILVSTLLMGILMVASLGSIAGTLQRGSLEATRSRAQLAAEAILQEILLLPNRDPQCDCGFGLESGESGKSRAGFDDVDDYDNYLESPLTTKDGQTTVGELPWTRRVTIEHVTPQNLFKTQSTYTGIYRITVRVEAAGKVVAMASSYRTANQNQPQVLP
jgi:type II secretory pathway pseudopilin PulG